MSVLASVARLAPLAAALVLAAPLARAAPPTKDECLDAHSKGQDAREAGRLADAGKLFLTCAQPACPSLVQSDCARFVDELEQLSPTVTFAARDGANNDLPETSVFVDGALLAPRLGDGKAYAIDPGRHEIRFVHGGKEAVVAIVATLGEKGRSVVGVFPSPPPASAAADVPAPSAPAPASPAPVVPETRRPAGPLVLVGVGAGATVAGGVLLGLGLAKVPDRCSVTTTTCAAAPGDPALGEAADGVKLANLGAIVGGIGVLTVAGSLFWYLAQPARPVARDAAGLRPWIEPQRAGVSFAGVF